jgi:hypothetical protein
MLDNPHHARRHDHAIERWSHALSVSKERLLFLIEEVVSERKADLLGAHRKEKQLLARVAGSQKTA